VHLEKAQLPTHRRERYRLGTFQAEPDRAEEPRRIAGFHDAGQFCLAHDAATLEITRGWHRNLREFFAHPVIAVAVERFPGMDQQLTAEGSVPRPILERFKSIYN